MVPLTGANVGRREELLDGGREQPAVVDPVANRLRSIGKVFRQAERMISGGRRAPLIPSRMRPQRLLRNKLTGNISVLRVRWTAEGFVAHQRSHITERQAASSSQAHIEELTAHVSGYYGDTRSTEMSDARPVPMSAGDLYNSLSTPARSLDRTSKIEWRTFTVQDLGTTVQYPANIFFPAGRPTSFTKDVQGRYLCNNVETKQMAR